MVNEIKIEYPGFVTLKVGNELASCTISLP